MPQPQPCDARHFRVSSIGTPCESGHFRSPSSELDADARFALFAQFFRPVPARVVQSARFAVRLCVFALSRVLSRVFGGLRSAWCHTHDMSIQGQKQLCGWPLCLGVISWVFVCSFVCSDPREKLSGCMLCSVAAKGAVCEVDDSWARERSVSGGSGQSMRVRERQTRARQHLAQQRPRRNWPSQTPRGHHILRDG